MKLKIEIDPSADDEVIIRAKSFGDEVKKLEEAFLSVMQSAEISLTLGDDEYFTSLSDILFFETEAGKVTCHTKERMLYYDGKLYELERILPHTFVRVSKSCIINSYLVDSLSRDLTGGANASFKGSYKKAYISRMYYKMLKEKIYETRLSK